VKRLLHRIDTTVSSDCKTGSGRRRTARTDGNASVVEELALSQEEEPGTHRTVRQIARETVITKSSVHRIIHLDLKFKCFKKRMPQDLTEANKNKRLACSRKLLRRYAEHSVPFIWFTDEKLFHAAPPVNLQNDLVISSPSRRTVLQPTKPVRLLHCCQQRHPTSSAHRIGHRTVQIYANWGIPHDRVYRSQIRDVDHLKERLIEEWSRFDQNIIDRAVNQWRD